MKKIYFIFYLLSMTLVYGQSYSGGTGTNLDPFLISTKADLKYLSENSTEWSSKHYKQTANIVFVAADFQSGGNFYNSGAGFKPIGTDFTDKFINSSYDGQNYTIENLYINNTTSGKNAFFGIVNSSTISNVSIVGGSIYGQGQYAAGLVAYCSNSTSINNCNTSCTVTGFEYSVGGLVGVIDVGCTVNNSYATGTINGSKFVGGLVGTNQGTITNSYATGNVVSTGGNDGWAYYYAGFVGNNFGTIDKCYATGNVSSIVSVEFLGSSAGFVTENDTDGVISNCYSTGNVTGSSEIGSFVGRNVGEIKNCFTTGDITGTTLVGGFIGFQTSGPKCKINNCYSTGSVSGTSDVGGFCGNKSSGIIGNCFYDSETSGQSDSGVRGTPKTTFQMQSANTFINSTWDFSGETTNGTEDLWKMGLCTNNGYPVLASQSTSECPTYCGVELGIMSEQLMMKGIATATNYEIEAFDGTNYLYWLKNSGLLGFKMSNFVGVKYNTTYQVKVRAFVGSWQSWGAACNITTPKTKVRDNFCGTTLTTMEDQLMIYAAKDATNFQYEAFDGTNTLTFTKNSGALGFKMSNFVNVKYNVTYQVKVKAYIEGTWQDWGAICTITTPNTKVVTNFCGNSLTNMEDQLMIFEAKDATNYLYEASDGTNILTFTKNSGALGFKMSNFVNVKYNTTYQVKVKALIGGTWRDWGAICTITTPNTKVVTTFCGNSLTTMEDQLMIFEAKDATNYQYEAFDGSNILTYTKNSGALGFKMSNFVNVKYNATYQVKVKAYIGGVWKDWGAVCTIITPPTKVVVDFCGNPLTTISDQLMIYAAKDASNYEFQAFDGTNTLTWFKGSALLGFKMSNFPGVLPNTSYQVKVRAIIGGTPQAWGDACTIITPAAREGNFASNEINNDENTQKFELFIYPNPNNGTFTISSTSEGIFQVTNELGQMVQKIELSKNNPQDFVASQNIQMNLKPGVYFISGNVNNEIFTNKIIVQ